MQMMHMAMAHKKPLNFVTSARTSLIFKILTVVHRTL